MLCYAATFSSSRAKGPGSQASLEPGPGKRHGRSIYYTGKPRRSCFKILHWGIKFPTSDKRGCPIQPQNPKTGRNSAIWVRKQLFGPKITSKQHWKWQVRARNQISGPEPQKQSNPGDSSAVSAPESLQNCTKTVQLAQTTIHTIAEESEEELQFGKNRFGMIMVCEPPNFPKSPGWPPNGPRDLRPSGSLSRRPTQTQRPPKSPIYQLLALNAWI